MKKIAALCNRLDNPSFVHRFGPLGPLLKSRGVHFDSFAVPKNFSSRWSLFRRLAEYDLVIISRKLFCWLDLSYIRRVSKRLVFDFDDAIMHTKEPRSQFRSSGRAKLFRRTVSQADHVVCGNEYLRQQTEKDRQATTVIETPVDLNRYHLRPDLASDKVVLGWIGSASTSRYLEAKLPLLDQILRRYKNVSLKVVSDKAVSYPGMDITNKSWSTQSELADLQSFDIGLMPLADDKWTRGKCGFKLLQYFAVGTPAVASPVGINTQIAEDGVCGFLVNSDQQWLDRIGQLIQNQELRRSMGLSGRKRVEQRYSSEQLTPKYLEIFEKLMEKLSHAPLE